MMDRLRNSRSPSPFTSPGHNNRLRERHRRFNCQTVVAYLLSIIANFIIVFGVYKHWQKGHTEHHWLLLAPLGVVLIFIGSCIYRCGINRLYRYNYGHYRGPGVSKQQAQASPGIFESSQLSLNMLPQCFTNYDTVTGGVINTRDRSTTAATSTASAAAHRYLSLPLDSLLPPPSSHITHSVAEVHQANEQQLMAGAVVEAPLIETSVDNEAGLINVSKRNSQETDAEEAAEEAPVGRFRERAGSEPMNIIGQTTRGHTHLVELAHHPQAQSLGIQDYHSNESISRASVEVEVDVEEEEVNVLNNSDSIFEVDSINDDYSGDEEASVSLENDHSGAPSMNEAPPTYEEVIDFDHSIALVSNYQTL